MKLLDFLSEKAMNMATFSDTEKRLGGTALVGFEFEVAVGSDSPYYAEDVDNRETQVISYYDRLDEFTDFFDAPRSGWQTIESDYESWKEASKFSYVDDEWENYLDEENGIGEDEARKEAEEEWEERLAHKFEFGDWLKDQFGKERIDFVNSYGLEPRYGWYTDHGPYAAIYTEEKEDDDVTHSTAEELAVGLRNVVDAEVEVHREYHEGKKSLSKWYIEPDGSIEGGIGLEIVSPPQKLSKALSDMEDVCEWIAGDGLKTNSSTGLHVNVSIPGIDANLDPVKLALFMGERYSLGLFNRLGNTYAAPHLKQLLTKVKASGRFPRGFEQMQKAATKYLSTDKYYSVNLGRLTDGYVEFRVAGGAGYESDIERLKKIVLRFVTAVEIACDPAAERQEYVKKLVKIFNTAFDLSGTSTEQTSSLVPGELNRLAKLQPSIKKELEVVRDSSRNVQDRRDSLIAVMAMVIPAVRNISSELSIKELAYLKRRAKEFEVRPNDVDLYYSDETGEPTSARKDFKTIYRI